MLIEELMLMAEDSFALLARLHRTRAITEIHHHFENTRAHFSISPPLIYRVSGTASDVTGLAQH